MTSHPCCLAISSAVLSGHVGLGAIAPVLSQSGVECIALPTVILSGHAATPGVTSVTGYGALEIKDLARGLAAGGALNNCDTVMTGYLRDAEIAHAVADLLETMPQIPVFCDPVLGDAGRLYLPQAVGEVLRHRILPRAKYASPNLFELGWLTGQSVQTRSEIVAAARLLGVETVFVTSVEEGGRIGVLTVTPDDAHFFGHTRHDRHFHGAGDVTSALLVAHLLKGWNAAQAAAATVQKLAELTASTPVGRGDLWIVGQIPPETG